ncbi:MAG: TatD family hydrolase [Candidatus Marinimicrobia bacterium]|nr:TatD family hydrolase [Candidatus Neomarinimicrobiota bacterium]
MSYIDTHCHIYMDRFDGDRDDVIQRAIDNGVERMICIGVDLPSSEKCLQIAEKHPQVFATAGIHPHEAKDAPPRYLHELEAFYQHPKVVAVGEIGLDFHYNFSDEKEQIRVYHEQLELAKSVNLPTVVHCRESDDEILTGIIESNNNYGVIHCFASTLAFSQQILDAAFHLSFTGLITFVNALEDVVKETPLDRMMLETDSPYLAPIPHRGKRNEPLYVKQVAEKVAELKNMTVEDVVCQTTGTAELFFKKLN